MAPGRFRLPPSASRRNNCKPFAWLEAAPLAPTRASYVSCHGPRDSGSLQHPGCFRPDQSCRPYRTSCTRGTSRIAPRRSASDRQRRSCTERWSACRAHQYRRRCSESQSTARPARQQRQQQQPASRNNQPAAAQPARPVTPAPVRTSTARRLRSNRAIARRKQPAERPHPRRLRATIRPPVNSHRTPNAVSGDVQQNLQQRTRRPPAQPQTGTAALLRRPQTQRLRQLQSAGNRITAATRKPPPGSSNAQKQKQQKAAKTRRGTKEEKRKTPKPEPQQNASSALSASKIHG